MDENWYEPEFIKRRGIRAMTANPKGGMFCSASSTILAFDSDGNYTVYAGTELSGGLTKLPCSLKDLVIKQPEGIFASMTQVIVFDYHTSYLISIITSTERCERFAGNGLCKWKDGPRLQAGLGNVSSITMDSKGAIYMVDSRWSQLRMISAFGYVTTIGVRNQNLTLDGPFKKAAFHRAESACVRPATGEVVVVCSDGKNVRLVDTHEKRTVSTVPSYDIWDRRRTIFDKYFYPRDCCTLMDGTVILSSSYSLWQLDSEENTISHLGHIPNTSQVNHIAITKEGRLYFSDGLQLGYLEGWIPPYFPQKSGRLPDASNPLFDSMVSRNNLPGDFTPLLLPELESLVDPLSFRQIINLPSGHQFSLHMDFLRVMYGESFASHVCQYLDQVTFPVDLIQVFIALLFGAPNLNSILPDHVRLSEIPNQVLSLYTLQKMLDKVGVRSDLLEKRLREMIDASDVENDPSLLSLKTSLEARPSDENFICNILARRLSEISLELQGESKTQSENSFSKPNFVVSSSSEQYRVHDWILICRWPFVGRVLKAGMIEAQQRHLDLPSEMPPSVLLPLLVFLHTGEVPPSFETAEQAIFFLVDGSALDFSDLEGIPRPGFEMLFAQAQHIIQSPLKPQNAARILNYRIQIAPEEEIEDAVDFCARNLLLMADSQDEQDALEMLPTDTLCEVYFKTLSRLPIRSYEPNEP